MQEVVRRCDREIGKQGNKCGERVPEDVPTTFTVNSVTYEVDLCGKHFEDFQKALEPYIHIAEPTRARNGTAVRKALKGKKGTFTTKDVRRWLQEQGRDVAPSGRIPNALIDEYRHTMKV